MTAGRLLLNATCEKNDFFFLAWNILKTVGRREIFHESKFVENEKVR